MPEGKVQQQFDRRVFALPVVCPAGTKIAETLAGVACRCHIEQSTITQGEQPSSLVRYCMSGYQECPTWRADKENRWLNKSLINQDLRPTRPKVSLLDQDPETVPSFVVPRA